MTNDQRIDYQRDYQRRWSRARNYAQRQLRVERRGDYDALREHLNRVQAHDALRAMHPDLHAELMAVGKRLNGLSSND